MAVRFPTWTFFTAVIVLAPQLYTGSLVFIFYCLQQYHKVLSLRVCSFKTIPFLPFIIISSVIDYFDLLKVNSVFTPPGENSCSIRSTVGPMVQLRSSFKIYCTFKCKCKGSMYSDHPPTPKAHEVFNTTTIYINVASITRNQTYSCQCDCPHASDSCGMDIFTGCECKIIPQRFLGRSVTAPLCFSVFLVPNPKSCCELCFTLQLL